MESIMKSKKRLIVSLMLIILVALWMVSFLSPQLTIRRYMLTRLHPISAITSEIIKVNFYEKSPGHLYNASNFVDRATRDEIDHFYLKKIGPFWFVSDAGTGP